MCSRVVEVIFHPVGGWQMAVKTEIPVENHIL